MKRYVTGALVWAFLSLGPGCGLTETEAVSPADLTYVACPKQARLTFEEAASLSSLVVHARPTESFFVDHCHRAFLLDVESVWLGDLPDPVLAIIRIDPYEHSEQWVDLDRGETAVFFLERDPEVPEAFRPVGEGAVIPVDKALAEVCFNRQATGCDVELVHIHSLQAFFDQSPTPHPADGELELDDNYSHDSDEGEALIDYEQLADELLDLPESGEDGRP